MRSEGVVYRLERRASGLAVAGRGHDHAVGGYAAAEDDGVAIKLSPGSQTYYEAREHDGQPVSDAQLLAGVIVATLAGHPDAEEDRAGTR